MNVLVIGLSHKTAPIELREKLTFSPTAQAEALQKLLSYDHIAEAVILSTCNRTEIYAVVDEVEGGKQNVVSFLCDYHRVTKKELLPHLYFHSLEKAVRHLFRVVSSLDSMVVGEAQILGQVREAYNCAFEAGATSIIFNRLFTNALRVGKRARSETAIGESAVSVSSVAVDLAKAVFENLSGRTVMILGAGETSELTAQALKTAGVKSLLVSNRTYKRAVELAKIFGGRAVKFDEFMKYMAKVDIVVSSTAAPSYIVTREDMLKVMHERKHAPIFLIDIAVPRDIEPSVGDIYNVFLYDIDDLQAVVKSNLAERAKEAEKVERIVQEEVDEFISWISSLEVTPTIAALKEKAEKIRMAEVRRVLNKLEHLSDREKNIIQASTKVILSRFLHEPIIRLKSFKDKKEGYLYVESLRRLFGLGDESKTSKKGE